MVAPFGGVYLAYRHPYTKGKIRLPWNRFGGGVVEYSAGDTK